MTNNNLYSGVHDNAEIVNQRAYHYGGLDTITRGTDGEEGARTRKKEKKEKDRRGTWRKRWKMEEGTVGAAAGRVGNLATARSGRLPTLQAAGSGKLGDARGKGGGKQQQP